MNNSRALWGGGGSFKNRKRIGKIGCCELRMGNVQERLVFVNYGWESENIDGFE